MQGPGSSVSTLPDNINLDHGSSPGEAGIESQMSWNGVQTSVHNHLQEYRTSSETNIQYLQRVRPERLNAEWSLGEASSSSSRLQGDQDERKMEHTWNFRPQAALTLQERQYDQPNILSLDNVGRDSNGNQTNALPQDLNMNTGFVNEEDDDCRIVERPTPRVSVGPSNDQIRSAGSSSDSSGLPSGSGGFAMDEGEERPGSLDGRRVSCKRKALEVHRGQSSGGSSNGFQNDDRSQWHAPPAAQVAVSNTTSTMPTENNVVVNNGREQAAPRFRLGLAGPIPVSPFSMTSSRNAGRSRRNFRLRFNSLHQEDPIPENPSSSESDDEDVPITTSRFSSRLLRSHLFDLNPAPAAEIEGLHGESVQVPPIRQHHQSRWNGASSTRSSRSSAPAISEERNAVSFGQPPSRNVPRSISEHPMFIPANEMGSSSQNPMNWNLPGGNSDAGNVASTSRVGPSTGPNSSAHSWSNRNHPHYPRRLSEIVRRSLLSSSGAESGGQSSNHTLRANSSALAQEMAPQSGSDNHGHRVLSSRSALLDRHLDAAFGIPHSLRTLAAAGEGRSSIMSEQIRHVLDLMRRGEGLRFEDVMILDHTVLFGMADIHDRHRDMRLDVDNMSYEELLALEERIGNVCTGLTEETITSRLKQHKHADGKADDSAETEPCSICREEYYNGEDVGTLECGHDFHADCIKQWLMHKNLCPICKTTGLTT